MLDSLSATLAVPERAPPAFLGLSRAQQQEEPKTKRQYTDEELGFDVEEEKHDQDWHQRKAQVNSDPDPEPNPNPYANPDPDPNPGPNSRLKWNDDSSRSSHRPTTTRYSNLQRTCP